jgi:SAM-dependent methyltransferase
MEHVRLDRTPFSDPDRVPVRLHALMVEALEAMGRHPEIRRVRAAGFAALAPRPGQRLLDAGCGTGDVARQLAARVAGTGEVIALDYSAAFVAAARERHAAGNVTYRQGDVTRLDLPDRAVDGVWCERVLQHLSDPDAAIAELVRVTRPGGRVCLIDTDWDSLAFDGLPEGLTAQVGAVIGDRFAGWGAGIGRTLRRRLVRAGLSGVQATPVTCSFADPAAAAAVLPMVDPRVPAEAGFTHGDLRARWLEAVDQAGRRGDFLAALTIWVAAGTV